MLSLCTKAGTYNFYRTLEKLTNHTGVAVPPLRYWALQQMLVQWRHLKMLKWGGRGHLEDGIATTEEGKLTLVCPSCPQPDVNLPNDWTQASKERQYCNSDIIVAFVLRRYTEWLLPLIIAYNIMCQWFVNLLKRMGGWNENLQIPTSLYMTLVILKFHHPAHILNPQHDMLNCNYSLGLSDCNMECNKCLWSSLNGAAPSTKPMGPGSRILVLNNHFGHYNWCKYIGI
ncbi:hypothetical protein V5O48_016968, partial [Marasmius crinis-equi]